jgi:predicted Ser/Thr protein kinase
MPALEKLGKIGPYRLLEKIGEGGMGVVYLARDTENRPVAVKVLGPAVAGDPDARRRLAREVDTMRRVRSPYVAEILDADVTGKSPYIATRYVNGRTLDAVIKNDGPLRGAALDRLAAGLASALAAIHAAGVIHRDLKPGNVMMADGNPVVIDFGIAHISDALTKITQTGMVMGTPGYLAPEVIEGKESTVAADIHAWGATVAYAASGEQPYGTGTFQTVFFRVLQGKADLAGVPQRLLPLVSAALATNPRDRPSPVSLARGCGALLGGGGGAGDAFGGGVHDGRTFPDDPAHTRMDGPRGPRPGDTRMDGTRMDGTRLDGTRLDGTRVQGAQALGGPLGYPPGNPPGGGPRPGWQHGRDHDATLPGPRTAAANYSDLLPPVEDGYGRRPSREEVAAGREAARREAIADRAAEAARIPEGTHTVVLWALGVIAVALAYLLPLAGAVIALVAVTLLRAADYTHSELSGRGGRISGGDIAAGVLSAPVTVARSLLVTVTKLPFAIGIFAVFTFLSIIFAGAGTLPAAAGWGAAAAVAWTLLSGGARRPRRALRRVSHSVFRTRPAMTVAVISLCALAAAAVSSDFSQLPFMWPVTTWVLPGMPSVGNVLHTIQSWLLTHTVGMLHVS